MTHPRNAKGYYRVKINGSPYLVMPYLLGFCLKSPDGTPYKLPNGHAPRFATEDAARLFAAGVWPFPAVAL